VERIEYYGSFLDYLPHMFDGGPYPVGNISWHHLWFILYLFIISLLIAPVLNYTKSGHYNMVRGRLIVIISRKMGLNWLLPIIILSQLMLRQYFPNSTHALYNDWAYFTYYLLFFVSGFMLFTSDKIINALAKDRRLYLFQTIVFTILLFALPSIFGESSIVQDYSRGITEIVISLSCGLTAIGYFREYFNKDHKLRKVLNEAIYPFYLLHQPALIFVGYVVLQLDISYGMQAVLITALSLVFILSSYYIIKKFNFLRVVFGMKRKQKIEPSKIVNLKNTIAFNK